MMTYNFGDILLIRFPFTDQAGYSKRPALVLYDSGDNDVLLCRVTTRPFFSIIDLRVTKWNKAGLLKESYVRIGKMATLEKEMVNRKLGRLVSSDLLKAKQMLKEMFNL